MAWEQTDEEIIAYISGDLTGPEKEAFERRLLTDSALADALARHKAFEKRLQNYGAYQRKAEEINALNQQFSISQTISKRFRYLFLAAAILAILIAIALFVGNNKTYCPEELYTEVFAVRVAPEMAGQAQDAEQSLRLAHSQFNQQLIQEAILLYQQALDAGTLSSFQQEEIHFYLGQSFMLERDFDAARDHFGEISQGPYIQLSQWYVALSQLAEGQLEEANTTLEAISLTTGHDRQAEAVSLLKKWKHLKDCETATISPKPQ